MKVEILSKYKEETLKIGSFIAKFLFPGSIITLTGDLGAGKTTFTKGVGLGLGVKEEINSPTFNILKCYFNNTLNLYHIDAYRLEDVAPEGKNIGLEEVIEGDGVALIEWPMFIKEFLPEEILNVEILNINENQRKLIFSSESKTYEDILKKLKEAFKNA